jgi:hypothetical protein
MKLQYWHFFYIEVKRTLLIQRFLNIEANSAYSRTLKDLYKVSSACSRNKKDGIKSKSAYSIH